MCSVHRKFQNNNKTTWSTSLVMLAYCESHVYSSTHKAYHCLSIKMYLLWSAEAILCLMWIYGHVCICIWVIAVLYTFLLYNLVRPAAALMVLFTLTFSSGSRHIWWHSCYMLYSIDEVLFHMLYITAGVRLQLCLYAYDFVMSGCLCIHSVHENCYCVPHHCLQLLKNNTNKMLCGPPYPLPLPSLPPFTDTNSGPLWVIDAALIH